MQNQATPLHCASAGGHYDVAQLLLEKGAELNARADVSIIHIHVFDYQTGEPCNMKEKAYSYGK